MLPQAGNTELARTLAHREMIVVSAQALDGDVEGELSEAHAHGALRSGVYAGHPHPHTHARLLVAPGVAGHLRAPGISSRMCACQVDGARGERACDAFLSSLSVQTSGPLGTHRDDGARWRPLCRAERGPCRWRMRFAEREHNRSVAPGGVDDAVAAGLPHILSPRQVSARTDAATARCAPEGPARQAAPRCASGAGVHSRPSPQDQRSAPRRTRARAELQAPWMQWCLQRAARAARARLRRRPRRTTCTP